MFRMLASELGRLVLTSTAAIVCILAFGAAIKPLADGEIGPEDTVRLMVLAIIPMLQFALPFACSFAATMVYHRFASENEADAAMASGIPHRTLLTPAIAVGLVLSVAIGALMMTVIPNFLRQMESIVTRNVTDVLIERVKRGESIALGDFQIYAEDVLSTGPDPIQPDGTGSGAYERLLLEGVLAVQGDTSGGSTAVNARQVVMWFFDDSDESGNAIAVQLLFQGASTIDSTSPMSTYVERLNSQRIRIPGQFRDDPKFLTYDELQAHKENPSLMNRIDATRRVLAMRLAQRETLRAIDARLRAGGRATLQRGEDERLTIEARALAEAEDGWRVLPLRPGGGVPIEVSRDGRVRREYTASRVTLALDDDEARWRGGDWTNTYTLDTRDLTVQPEPGDPEAIPNNLGDRELTRLRPADPPERQLITMDSDELIALASGTGDEFTARLDGRIAASADRLESRIQRLLNDIMSKEHERAAYAVSSFLMVLVGAIVGFKMKRSMPLPVYLWSFFPALVTFVSISSGREFVQDSGASGLPALWAGVAFIALFAAYEFARLRRH